jgi:thiamine pyrophosphate-dependent acetolactate synthase large subunit-like protein
VPSWRVETADGLRGALHEALGAEAPALIEVMSDIGKDYRPMNSTNRGSVEADEKPGTAHTARACHEGDRAMLGS